MKPWCVQHRDGWCATATGKAPGPNANSVKTKCGYFVTLPWGSKKRVPTCQECKRVAPGNGAGQGGSDG